VFVAQANKSADQLKDFYTGIGIALEAMLVSPNVLFVATASSAWIESSIRSNGAVVFIAQAVVGR